MNFNSSHQLDVNQLKQSLKSIGSESHPLVKYAVYHSPEEGDEQQLDWEIDGYNVHRDEQNSVVYRENAVEIPIKNIPNFNQIKRHGSLIFETSEIVHGKKTPVLWDLKFSNQEYSLVQRKVQASFTPNFSRIRLAGNEVQEFINYCPIAKQVNIIKQDDNYFLDKNIDYSRLQQDIASAGFDVLLIKED